MEMNGSPVSKRIIHNYLIGRRSRLNESVLLPLGGELATRVSNIFFHVLGSSLAELLLEELRQILEVRVFSVSLSRKILYNCFFLGEFSN
jgi:hypothetical protein